MEKELVKFLKEIRVEVEQLMRETKLKELDARRKFGNRKPLRDNE